MKNRIVSLCGAAMAMLFFVPQTTSAGPVTSVANRTAHFVRKAGEKIDRHVIEPTNRHVVQPAKRVIVGRPSR